jgi:hypothetical protein
VQSNTETTHMDLRYNGFTQSDGVREFIFRGLSSGHEAKTIFVTVHLPLFRKYHIGLQEGPLLCLQKLTPESADLASTPLNILRRELCEDEIRAFAVEREHRREKKASRRRSRCFGNEKRAS